VSGAIKCWGKNNHGQLGDNAGGLGVETHVPVAVSGLSSGGVSISVGFDYACGVVGGAVKCWGNSPTGTETLVPADVAGVGVAASVSAGTNHVCAVTTAGAVRCWGDNSGGALGDGTQTDSKVPVSVISLP
jgi:alpha-tubulin suppressor-like RCC1 family protein